MTSRGTALQSTSVLTSAVNWVLAIICRVADSAAVRASLLSRTRIDQLPYSAVNNRNRFDDYFDAERFALAISAAPGADLANERDGDQDRRPDTQSNNHCKLDHFSLL
jgi:hypothetical protein